MPVQIGFQRRYDAAIAAAKAAVESGELGWINTIRPRPWTRAADRGVRGGVRRDVPRLRRARLRHHPVRHGQEAVEVYATGHQPGRRVLQEVRRPRHLRRDRDLRERHPRRRLQHPLQRPRLRRAARGPRLEGQRRRRGGRGLAHPRAAAGRRVPVRQPHRFFMDRFQPAFRAEFETFLEVVAGKRPSPCTVADGLEADWIAEACAKSQKEHRPVRIEEVRSTEALSTGSPGRRSPGASARCPAGATSSARQGPRRDARGRLLATELGPDGFLPAEPDAMATVLAHHGLQAVGGFHLLLHVPSHDPVPRSSGSSRATSRRTPRPWCCRRSAARTATTAAPSSTTRAGRRCWTTSAASARSQPRRASARCCTRTSAR